MNILVEISRWISWIIIGIVVGFVAHKVYLGDTPMIPGHDCKASNCSEDHGAVDVDQDAISELEKNLKPCPFHWTYSESMAEPYFEDTTIGGTVWYYASCGACGASVRATGFEEAAARWNTRRPGVR